MAYGNKYYASWASLYNQGYIYIDLLDYTGEAQELKVENESIVISNEFENWEDPVIGMRAEFNIINDKNDFFELLPLLNAEEREYKIRITRTYPVSSEQILFEGYLNCDTITQKYLHRQVIRFVASGYLKKLEYLESDIINIAQTTTFIDLIDEILCKTGAAYNIRVNCKIHAEGDILLEGQTLFNKNGFWTELFWEDQVERKDCLAVLKTILTSFNCYLYWWQGYWYIERFIDLFPTEESNNVQYIEYTTGSKYDPTDTGVALQLNKSINNVHSLIFTNKSQTLSIIPGFQKIKLELNDIKVLNLTDFDLANSIDFVDNGGYPPPEPNYRQWLRTVVSPISTFVWSGAGQPKGVITNAICRYKTSSVPILDYYGLTTKIKVTIDDKKTTLEINFKYLIEPNADSDIVQGWDNYKFLFHWYLRLAGTDNYLCKKGDGWAVHPATNQTTYLQELEVPGGDFDEDTNCVDISISVPIGEVEYYPGGIYSGLLKGDQSLVFCLGSETVSKDDIDDFQQTYAWFGDFEITATCEDQENVIEGTTNTKFLNKKELSIDLYDMESYNYKNGILRGDTLEIRTERWGTAEGLAQILVKGVCWSTNENPTLADSYTVDGTGYETFTSKLTNLTPATTYYVRAYITYDGGTIYGNQVSFLTPDIQVGQPYRGGIIGYIYAEGDEGYVEGEIHGIIAAVKDLRPDRWCLIADGVRPYQPGAYFNEMGDGKLNTEIMMTSPNASRFAAKQCTEYSNDGFSDWYLPNLRELLALYKNRALIPGFYKQKYWTSLEKSGSRWRQAYRVDFAISETIEHPNVGDTAAKNEFKNIRPISYF